MESVLDTIWYHVWQIPLTAAWVTLLIFAKKHTSQHLAHVSAIVALYLMTTSLMWYMVHEPVSHEGNDAAHDLEWAYYILLDLVTGAILIWRSAPTFTASLLVGSAAYQVIRIYAEPYGDLDRFLFDAHPFLFTAYLLSLLLSLWPSKAVDSLQTSPRN